jgi:hypothetical protein
MCRISLKVLVIGLACLVASPTLADTITYDIVMVGDPGNANDTVGSGVGDVAYSYQIGKYDVTIGQYTAFLSAVAATDTYSSTTNLRGERQHHGDSATWFIRQLHIERDR